MFAKWLDQSAFLKGLPSQQALTIVKKVLATAVAGVLGGVLMTACGGDDEVVTEAQVKENYVAMAYAAYSDSLSTAQSLQAAVDTFLETPNEQNLTAAKVAYKTARVPYQQSEIMRWDTSITIVSNTGTEGIASVDEWEGQVNAWPLDESLIDYVVDGQGGTNTGYIIAGTDAITTESLIDSNGAAVNGLTGDEAEANVATGVHAIEFLLWGQDLNGTDAGAGERPATDYSLENCTNENCDRRRTYLEVVTGLLVSDLEAMVAEWSPEAAMTDGTLAYNFLSSELALDYILLSMKSMATDELASARMGAGLDLLDPEEEHDCFSDMSHVAIYYNYQGVRNAFYGSYTSEVGGESVSGASIGDLIRQADEATYAAIEAAFTAIEEDMLAIYNLGEMSVDPIRFDQIIGEGLSEPQGDNFVLANSASLALVDLLTQFNTIQELLSLEELSTNGSGDGD